MKSIVGLYYMCFSIYCDIFLAFPYVFIALHHMHFINMNVCNCNINNAL